MTTPEQIEREYCGKCRLIDGRTDWRDADWQDHCGDYECERCAGFTDQHIAPERLSDEDKAVREVLMKEL